MTSLRQSWGPRKRDIGPKPVFQLVYEKSKMAEERKHGPLGPSLFESRGIDLGDVSAQDIYDLRSLLFPWKSRMEHIMQLPEHKVNMAYGVASRGSCLSHQLVGKPVDASSVQAPHTTKRVAPVDTVIEQSFRKVKDSGADVQVNVQFPNLPLQDNLVEDQHGAWPMDLAAVSKLRAPGIKVAVLNGAKYITM